MSREQWTDERVAVELRALAVEVGNRMPSAGELRRKGLNALACRVSRTRGGFKGWAQHLGLMTKVAVTAGEFGRAWEEYVTSLLRSLRYEAELQSSHAPFDVLVNGRIKVNVKAATWKEYGNIRGYFFGIGKTWKTCHLFALVRVQQDAAPLPVLWVPAAEAQQQTITLTASHRFNGYTSLGALSRGGA